MADVKQELKDIFENGRSFEKEDGTRFYVVPPEADEIRKAQWHYSKIYNQAFVDGVTTVAEMRDALVKRGLLGDDFDSQSEKLRSELDEIIAEMNDTDDKEKKKDLATKAALKRQEVINWNERASAPLSQTCESLADDARLEYLASCMVRNEDGDRVWDGYDSYLNEKDAELSMLSRFEVMLFLQGLDSDLMSQLPERVVLNEAEESEVEESEETKDEDEDEDEDGDEEVEEVETKPKKKTTRKRTTKKSS